MNMDQLREEIASDEGVRLDIYLDHLGLPTVGIGHLIREADAEHGKPVGTQITPERCRQLFALDIAVTVEDCRALFENWDDLPKECQLILANMAFNLGRSRLGRFLKLRAAIVNYDYDEAATQMADSKWARQVPNRAGRLIDRMRALSDE